MHWYYGTERKILNTEKYTDLFIISVMTVYCLSVIGLQTEMLPLNAMPIIHGLINPVTDITVSGLKKAEHIRFQT